eukprot:TRINITY_DN52039_c0_g1_i1.p1 TRINITY_DN52039_c0_g1~~TRINITY_DN52039_c0_g1_i1.p1  ORF type:complete len:256 (+),score=40.73 TRINITY_DN52039_c0_g1_i1:92-859(+)
MVALTIKRVMPTCASLFRKRSSRQQLLQSAALAMVLFALLERTSRSRTVVEHTFLQGGPQGKTSSPGRRSIVLAPFFLPSVTADAATGVGETAGNDGEFVHIARPVDTDSPLYEFDIPAKAGFKEIKLKGYKFQKELLARTCRFFTDEDATLSAGEAPGADFVTKQRKSQLPANQKVLKMTITDTEDNLEVKAKQLEADGTNSLWHRWWRVLKETDPASGNLTKSALINIEIKEDRFAKDGPIAEAILKSFRFGR